MSALNAIPGMASYMETEVDVEVNVGTPEEVVAEAEETAAEAVEVEATDAEVQEDAAEAEQMFARFDELDRMQAYVAKYGVDRAFLALNSYEGSLAAALVTLPSCEGFDVTGDVSSPASIACIEGFKEAAKTVWAFIKRMAEKIKDFVLRIVEAIRRRFTSIDSNIKRLETAYGEREDAPEKVKDSTTKVYSAQQIANVGTATAKECVNSIKGIAAGLQTVANDIAADKSGEKIMADQLSDKLDELAKKLSNMKSNRDALEPIKLSGVAWTDVNGLIAKARETKSLADDTLNTGKVITSVSDAFVRIAKGMEARGDEGGRDAHEAARKGAKVLNKINSVFSEIVKLQMWAASQCLRTASLRITVGGKKKAI